MAERYGWINRALSADELDGSGATLAQPLAALAPGVAAGEPLPAALAQGDAL